jgi:hypothetical protein
MRSRGNEDKRLTVYHKQAIMVTITALTVIERVKNRADVK